MGTSDIADTERLHRLINGGLTMHAKYVTVLVTTAAVLHSTHKSFYTAVQQLSSPT